MTRRLTSGPGVRVALSLAGATILTAAAIVAAAQPTFDTPEAAVRALVEAVRAERVDTLLELFGTEGTTLVDNSNPATARRNRAVFAAAAAEGWQLVDDGPDGKSLVVGRERWPFPVPIVRRDGRWMFDGAAGKEEVIARRIGRNELGAIRVCRLYVSAQQQYAKTGHDGKPAGVYAQKFRSDTGTHNGLYWPPVRGEKRSPLGDLLADAGVDGHKGTTAAPAPFHGYYYRILTAQGRSAPGGAKDYVQAGRLSGGFALVAWPAEYGVTGIMTFIVNQDGVVKEQDLGPGTTKAAGSLRVYDPGAKWTAAEPSNSQLPTSNSQSTPPKPE
jgi:hypothetical protein